MCGSPHHKITEQDLAVVIEEEDRVKRAEAWKLADEWLADEAAGRTDTRTEIPNVPAPGARQDMDVDIPPRYRIADHLMMDAATMLLRNIYGHVRG